MKLFCILFFLFFLHVEAQRRARTRPEVTSSEQPARSRGRSRFANPEYIQPLQESNKPLSSRRRSDTPIERQNYAAPITPNPVSYEVQEIVDETDPALKPRVLTETNFELSKPEVGLGDNSEAISKLIENPAVEETIPSDTNFEIEPQRSTEKVVPITRNNVRHGAGTIGTERNGNSRSGTRNGFLKSNENSGPVSRNGLSRSRSEESVPSSRRVPVTEDTLSISKPDVGGEIHSRYDTVTEPISESVKDENEIRKEIVRQSVPKLPQPITIPKTPVGPKKTVRKTLRTRVSDNPQIDEPSPVARAKSNPRVVENYVPSPRTAEIPKIEHIRPYSRSNPGLVEENFHPRGRTIVSPRDSEYTTAQRTRANIGTEEPIIRPRSRSRPAEVTPTPTVSSRTNQRGLRRRPETSTTGAPTRRVPSVEESPSSRSRTGRKIGQVETIKTPTNPGQNVRSRTNRVDNKRTQVSEEKSNDPGRRQTSRFRSEELVSQSTRHRFNARSPLNIDESKLEVLPLFEGETKIISDTGRKPNQLDALISGATENENVVLGPPENVTPLSETAATRKEDVGLHPNFKRKPYKKPQIKESVISQVTEVTSKRTITRKPISRPGGGKSLKAKPSNGLTSSEEDISDSDNYPAPFKALLQSKKQGKVEDLENEVQPKPSSTSTTLRPTRKRLVLSTKHPDYPKNNKSTTSTRKFVSRSTQAPSKEPKEHKFHSKFSDAITPTSKPVKSAVARGLYNSRKNKENEKSSFNRTRNSVDTANSRGQGQQTTVQKNSRYSSKYRTSGPSRAVSRASTAPPAYIPTVPAVRGYSSIVKPQEDPDLGLEYITFDAPLRSISSANLINGEYQPSSDSNFNFLDAKQDTDVNTTEKPASIIERIINSITGINITTDPTSANSASPTTVEPTKSSAILSLAPKKTTKKSDDLTQPKIKSNKRDATTSEKPTTVIQRILNSLSAIQAATTTDTTTIVTTDSAAKQVGSNFNTLSSGATTPSNLDRETASFSSTLAPSSTINPLVVFDTISDEHVLQKKTIGKLLEILNSLTTPYPDSTKLPDTTKLVYVTPKLGRYFYNTPSVMDSGTLKSTIDSVVTSTESILEPFTSSLTTLLKSDQTVSDTIPTDTPLATMTIIPTTSDAPLSVSLGVGTTQHVEDNILFTTRGVTPIVLNIQSLLASTVASTSTTIPLQTTTSSSPSFTTMETTSTTPNLATMTSIPNLTTMKTTSATSIIPNQTTVSSTASLTTATFVPTTTIITSTTPVSPTTKTTTTSSTITESSSTDSLVTTELNNMTPTESDLTATSTEIASTETILSYPSTLSRFEVSPDSVSIFSANDLLSNAITPDDFPTTTISIPSRISDAFVTTERTTFAPFDISTFSTQGRLTSTALPSTTPIATKSTPEPSTSPSSIGSTKPNVTCTPTDSERSGKLLQKVEDEVSNNIDTSSMGPDFFVFAVLPNNTILRKRPSVYPQGTPFVIVGVYPNNTVVRKFPNGTLVPMERVIRVTSMSSKAPSDSVNNTSSIPNKPEPITTTTKAMETSAATTDGSVEISRNNTSTSPNTVTPDNVISSSTPVSTTLLPSISELLNGKIVQAFNDLVNNTTPKQETTTQVEDNTVIEPTTTIAPKTSRVTANPLNILTTTGTPSFLNTILSTLQSIGTTELPTPPIATTQSPIKFSSTYRAPFLTTKPISTTPSVATTTQVPTTTAPSTVTVAPTTTTAASTTITTTSKSEDSTTPPPFTSKPVRSTVGLQTSTLFPYFAPDELPLLSIFSTERTRRTNSVDSSTTKRSTTNAPRTTTIQSTLIDSTTVDLEELLKKPIDSIKPKKKLTEQQKKDLETVRQLEKEQAALLKQLSFLTKLNLNGNSLNNVNPSDNLATRIISLAKERDSRKVKSPKIDVPTTIKTTTTTPKPSEPPKSKFKSEDDAETERMKQIENLIKLLSMNGVTPSPNKASSFGTSNDAILAAILKERGIGPYTPKDLADQIDQVGVFTQTSELPTTTKPTRKPRPTTQPTRGPIINWILSALAPPPTKAPLRKAKTTKKPKPKPVVQEILTSEPTNITPVVTALPSKDQTQKSVSQDDIQKLIRQLEAIQKDPSAAKNLDLTSFKNLQNLNKNNVQVFMPGSSGVSQRETTRPVTRAVTQRSRSTSTLDPSEIEITTSRSSVRSVRTSTFSPTPVSNSIFDDVEDEPTTKRARVTIPPVRLRPVSGVSDDAGSMVRGRLLTAAVNVTRAISGFLGSALQGAASSWQNIMASGSRLVGNFAQGSSAMVTDTGE